MQIYKEEKTAHVESQQITEALTILHGHACGASCLFVLQFVEFCMVKWEF